MQPNQQHLSAKTNWYQYCQLSAVHYPCNRPDTPLDTFTTNRSPTKKGQHIQGTESRSKTLLVAKQSSGNLFKPIDNYPVLLYHSPKYVIVIGPTCVTWYVQIITVDGAAVNSTSQHYQSTLQAGLRTSSDAFAADFWCECYIRQINYIFCAA